MRPLARAVNAPELLDEAAHEMHELDESLGHVASVNRWLGGVRSLRLHATPFLHAKRTTRVLDIGTGSGDLPRKIVEWARAHHRQVEVVATDLHPQMLQIAQAKCATYPEIKVERADALSLGYAAKTFDIATLSLTLHHFDHDDQLRIMRELARVTREAIIVNELKRSRMNYLGARLLALTFWRGNRLTRHDGPLSVLRAFQASELMQLSAAAGLNGRVYSHYFQRVVLVAEIAN